MLASCSGEPESEEGLGQPVTLGPVLAMDIVDRIEATGQLLAKEHAKIAAEVGGRITEVLIDEGARVEAGAEVMAIDPERRSLERDSARAGVEEAVQFVWALLHGLVSLRINRPDYAWSKRILEISVDAALRGLVLPMRGDGGGGLARSAR